ncbi:MAG: universal stress protein [Dehalococcoidia bacterium]
MYQRILVPLDGSDVARQVLPYAASFAKAFGAGVELIEAVSPFPRELRRSAAEAYADEHAMYPPSTEQWTEVQTEGREAARERLEAVAQGLRNEGLSVETTVVEGSPAESIAGSAKKVPGTLTALSTHGRSGIGRWVLGSVTDKVIRLAEAPVLVVRAGETAPAPPRISNVILPLDGSETAEAALPHAVAAAKALGASLTLLRSISPLVYGDTFADYVPAMYEDLAAEMDAEVRGYLGRMAERARGQGVRDVEEHAVDGYAANAILDEMGTAGDRMVVMATHGRMGIERWVLGSVTDRVVRHGSGPVLVVHPHQQ